MRAIVIGSETFMSRLGTGHFFYIFNRLLLETARSPSHPNVVNGHGERAREREVVAAGKLSTWQAEAAPHPFTGILFFFFLQRD